MAHDPSHRPKRPRDPIKAAYEIFQEVIGEKPRISPRQSIPEHPPEKPSKRSKN
jgi:hypothetical protein